MHDRGQTSSGARPTVIRGARYALGPRESSRGSIGITDGRVAYLRSESSPSFTVNSGYTEIDLGGFFIMPGLINAHDHLQFALHPRLADPPYRNYVDWGEDIHNKFSNIFAKHRSVTKGVRLWWGGIRNLLCGVTTVSHHGPLWAELQRNDFPVTLVQRYGWGHSLALGGDLQAARSTTAAGSPFIVHACEGVDEQAREELFELDRLGLLDDSVVLVHGLAFDEAGVELMKARRVSLIICPTSNEFLFGKLPDTDLFGGIANVALGSDSPLTCEGDLLDEVRFAIRRCGILPESAYRMVTDASAAMLRLDNAEGSIKVSGVGDLIAVRDKNRDASDMMRTMSTIDVEFVMIGGSVQLASQTVLARIPSAAKQGLEPLWVDGIVRWIRAPVKELLRKAEAVLGVGEVRLGAKPVCAPEYLEAQHDC